MDAGGLMVWREELVEFRKKVKGGEDIVHKARIITYVNMKNHKKAKLTRLLTNDLETAYEEIVATYDARWEIESLFKQLKQNFPLRYFYGESANAIKIQIWVTLIAKLLLMLLQKKTTRSWSFSGLDTMVRIMLMYYIDVHGFLEHPEKDWEEALEKALEAPPESEQN
jgi:IS4 transposase